MRGETRGRTSRHGGGRDPAKIRRDSASFVLRCPSADSIAGFSRKYRVRELTAVCAKRRSLKRVLCVIVGTLIVVSATQGTAFAQGIGVGVKGGVVFPDFSTDVVQLDSQIGWQGGIFFGGNRDGVFGAQLEVNWLHKRADSPTLPGFEAKLDYLQVPILLRLHSPSRSAAGFQLYGIVGPTFDFKMRESIAGLNVSGIDDAFENFDVGAIVGGRLEFGTVIVEGRYSRGFRQINKDFQNVETIKAHAFAVLLGFRFN